MKTSLVRKHSGHIISARLPQFIQGRLPKKHYQKHYFHKKKSSKQCFLIKNRLNFVSVQLQETSANMNIFSQIILTVNHN